MKKIIFKWTNIQLPDGEPRHRAWIWRSGGHLGFKLGGLWATLAPSWSSEDHLGFKLGVRGPSWPVSSIQVSHFNFFKIHPQDQSHQSRFPTSTFRNPPPRPVSSIQVSHFNFSKKGPILPRVVSRLSSDSLLSAKSASNPKTGAVGAPSVGRGSL